jgi:hypothetical protein
MAIEGLPLSDGIDVILIIINRFTKYGNEGGRSSEMWGKLEAARVYLPSRPSQVV